MWCISTEQTSRVLCGRQIRTDYLQLKINQHNFETFSFNLKLILLKILHTLLSSRSYWYGSHYESTFPLWMSMLKLTYFSLVLAKVPYLKKNHRQCNGTLLFSNVFTWDVISTQEIFVYVKWRHNIPARAISCSWIETPNYYFSFVGNLSFPIIIFHWGDDDKMRNETEQQFLL